MLQRSEVLDLYFIDVRSRLIDIAAFLDRVERADGEDDFRLHAFRRALAAVAGAPPGTNRAERALLELSDPTLEPAPAAKGKAACGAWETPAIS